MNQNLNYLFIYCTFVPAENSLNAQPSPMRKRWWQCQKTLQTMKILITFFILFILGGQASSQKVFEHYIKLNDSLRYGYGKMDFFPYNDKGYTLFLPDTITEISGIIISLDDKRYDTQNISKQKLLYPQANAKGFAVLYVSTGIPLDLYFNESSIIYVDTLLKDIFIKYKLPNKNIFFIGDMVSGHRALKYIEYCKNGKSKFNPNIKGVVLSECAIDWVRQWYECQKQARDHLTESGFFEGNLITYLFKKNIKETPISNINKFIEFSSYSYFDTKMQKPKLFKDLAIRAYTYADIRYWFSAQGKGVYDSNYPDMSGFINEQKLAGNKKAELIVFRSNPDEQLKDNQRPQTNTWDLIDKNELVNWLLLKTK